jgi:hypothetical protein
MRVGDINSNFKNSVVNRLNDDSELNPMWGYNSEKCCGFKSVSLVKHELLLSSVAKNNCYVLCLPNKTSNIVGIAKIRNISKREIGPLIAFTTTNEENGWNSTTAYGYMDWDYEMIIEKYWDITKLFNDTCDIFSYNKLFREKGKRLSQASVHLIEENTELHRHLSHHIHYIINYLKPTYEYKI